MFLTKEEFDNENHNIMTIMENHLMNMCGCDRTTANLMANEVLDLNNQVENIIESKVKEG